VDVHVDLFEGGVDEEDCHRVAAGRKRVAVGVADRELQQAIADRAPVHVDVQLARPAAQHVGRARVAAHREPAERPVHRHELLARLG
jgi:hypothetical protein